MKFNSFTQYLVQLCIGIAALFVSTTSTGQEVRIKANVSSRMPRIISDWQSTPNCATLTVTSTRKNSMTGRLKAALYLNDKLFARIKDGKEPLVTVEPGSKIIPVNEQIGDLSIVEFLGDAGINTARTKILPEGNYKLCLGLQEIAQSGITNVFNGEDCANFFMAQVRRTTIISPQPNYSLPYEPNQQYHFVWTPADANIGTLKPQYNLVIVPVFPNQDVRGAFASNEALFMRTVEGTSTMLGQNDLAPFMQSTSNQTIAARVDLTLPTGFTVEGEVASYTISLPTDRPVTDSDCVKIRKEYESVSQALEKQKKDCDELRKKLAALEAELADAEAGLADAKGETKDAQDALDAAQEEAEKAQKDLDNAIKNLNAMLPDGFSVDIYNGAFGDRPNPQSNAIGRSGTGADFPNPGGVAVQWGGEGSGQAGANTLIGMGPMFWDAFRDANKKYQANASAQKKLADAKQKKADADKKVSDLENKIKDLKGQIDDLKKQLEDCDKETEKLIEERTKIVEVEEECLKRVHEQKTAEEKIKDAQDAIDEAQGSKSEAEKSIGDAENAAGGKPNTDKEKEDAEDAKGDVEEGNGHLSEAQRLLDEARKALEAGDAKKAQDLADSAKKEADKADDKYDDANRTADRATDSANAKPTQEQIDAEKKRQEDEAKRQEELRQQEENEAAAENLVLEEVANQLTQDGIPKEVADCLVRDKAAWEAFMKWLEQEQPKNIDLKKYRLFAKILTYMGKVASAVAKAMAKGQSIVTGIMKGLASGGIGFAAGLFYDWAGDAAKAAAKKIADNHVKNLIAAQATGNYGVIHGKSLRGQRTTTSYFYMKDCKTGKYHIFRITASYGFEYLGVSDL